MSEIMNSIYYMIVERIGQECAQDAEMKILRKKKCALIDEIAYRIGKDGDDLVETMTNLDASMDNIQGKALFRAAVQLGTELARPEAGVR